MFKFLNKIVFFKVLYKRYFYPRIPRKKLEALAIKLLDEEFYQQRYMKGNIFFRNVLSDFLSRGVWQLKIPCEKKVLNKRIDIACDNKFYSDKVLINSGEVKKTSAKFRVACHSKGNFFFHEIATIVSNTIAELGFDSKVVQEKNFHEVLDFDCHVIVIAPQEFFLLGRAEKLYQIARKKMPYMTYILAEQAQTKYFLSQLMYLFDPVQFIDINYHTAIYLRSLGFDCLYMPLGCSASTLKTSITSDGVEGIYVNKNNKTSELGFSEREIECAFIGNASGVRKRFFNRHAEFFASRNSFLFIPDWDKPYSETGFATLNRDSALEICRKTKVFLNISRDDSDYFDWLRICMRGFISGALVLTTPVRSVSEFNSGVHYIEAPLDDIPEILAWLLDTSEGQKKAIEVAAAGKKSFLETSLKNSLSDYLSHIEKGGLLVL